MSHKFEKGQEHAGHRARLRAEYHDSHTTMRDYQLLEILLMYVIKRRDTNLIAHRLITHFGSISRVMRAEVSELMQIPGLGEKSAEFIKEANKLVEFINAESVCYFDECNFRWLLDDLEKTDEHEAFACFRNNANQICDVQRVQFVDGLPADDNSYVASSAHYLMKVALLIRINRESLLNRFSVITNIQFCVERLHRAGNTVDMIVIMRDNGILGTKYDIKTDQGKMAVYDILERFDSHDIDVSPLCIAQEDCYTGEDDYDSVYYRDCDSSNR